MRLKKRLEKNKSAIVEQWFDALAKTYPPDTARFIKSQKDTFANPVGGTARQTLAALFDELMGSAETAALTQIIDPLIRIRAVQTLFTPSQALAFIPVVKTIVRDRLGKDLSDPTLASSVAAFEQKVDHALLVAFDVFQSCREHIYRLKAAEEQSKVYKAFARAGLVTENPLESEGSGET